MARKKAETVQLTLRTTVRITVPMDSREVMQEINKGVAVESNGDVFIYEPGSRRQRFMKVGKATKRTLVDVSACTA